MKTLAKMKIALPKYVRVADRKWPSTKGNLGYELRRKLEDEGVTSHFEMWHVGDWGWVIPVLLIRKAGRRSASHIKDRQYAVRVENGELVRVGLGPHVDETVDLYLSKFNLKRLAPLIERMREGSVKANRARDIRSTRALRRSLWGMR